ncbi:hypothetical protein [Streptomyces sp. SA15]|uniref:hypothetical protein n=1 Tax=Streptomyces sp. SA15 TaxID=934019 RepID=UPI001180FE0D|nr:hypothetical protein [Streptomyces sp. SA15]
MRSRIAILAVTVVLPLTAVTSLSAANQAAADPQSGKVVVWGQVADCPSTNAPTKVEISSGAEAIKTDANAGVARTGLYAVIFENIPKGVNQRATATVTCGPGGGTNTYQDQFRITRPAAGELVQKTNLEP